MINRKNAAKIITAISIPLCGLGIYLSLRSLTAARDAQAIVESINSARVASEGIPHGQERAAELIRRLRLIETGNSSPQVKRAFEEYVLAMESSFAALQRGEDIGPYDRICGEKANALKDAVDQKR